MNCFFIAKSSDSDLAEEHLREVFSDLIPLVPGFSWFAGGGYDSPREVSDLLGINGQRKAIVILLDRYSGVGEGDTVRQLRIWRSR